MSQRNRTVWDHIMSEPHFWLNITMYLLTAFMVNPDKGQVVILLTIQSKVTVLTALCSGLRLGENS